MSRDTRLRSLFISPDFLTALIAAVLFFIFWPDPSTVTMAKELFSIAVTVLALVFPLYFAGAAIVIAAGDNQFVAFLEEEGRLFSFILRTFQITLWLLFSALLIAIVLQLTTLPLAAQEASGQGPFEYPRWILVGFGFIGSWALFAAILAANEAFKYAHYRAQFAVLAPYLNQTEDSERISTKKSPAPPTRNSGDDSGAHTNGQ